MVGTRIYLLFQLFYCKKYYENVLKVLKLMPKYGKIILEVIVCTTESKEVYYMKVGDIVRYNGGTESFAASYDDPSCLKVGGAYRVASVKVKNWTTDVQLVGVKGTFNSVWFDELSVRKRFEMEIDIKGKAAFKVDENSNVFDSEGFDLGQLVNLANFCKNRNLILDFKNNEVRKGV